MDLGLKLSDNSKVKFKNGHYNTFGLMYGLPSDGGTCPGATSGTGGCLNCRNGHKRPTCYMSKVCSIYKGVAPVLKHNTELLRNADETEMITLLSEAIHKFVKICKGKDKFFRLHYSGDFFSSNYAAAFAKIMIGWGDVKFWGYTRSFDYVPLLAEVPNLQLYLSCDPVNYDAAVAVSEKHPNVRLSWLGDNPPAAQTWVNCAGKCSTCRRCIDGESNVRFSLH